MRFARFLAFARRFAPLWGVWLLVVLFPASREVWRLHFLGSPLTRDQMPWTGWLEPRRFNAFLAVKAHPRDLDMRLWRWSQMMQGLDEDSDSDDDAGSYAIAASYSTLRSARNLLREAQTIRRDFPREKWLRVLPSRVVALKMEAWPSELQPGRSGPPMPGAMPSAPIPASAAIPAPARSQLLAVIREAARLDPKNAFYPLVEAQLQQADGWPRHEAEMWSALKRAAQGAFYDDGSFFLSRRLVAAHEKVRPLLLEEKQAVWRAESSSNFWFVGLLQSAAQAADAQKRAGRHKRAIEMTAITARIVDLMQRAPNSLQAASSVAAWKSTAWRIAPAQRGRLGQSRDFARYAASHGRGDVAAQVPLWAARQRQIEQLAQADRNFVPQSALHRTNWWRDAGGLLMVQGAFVAAFWMIANIFLWRGRGAPSSRPARAIPALVVAVLSASLAYATWLRLLAIEEMPWTTRRGVLEGVAISFCVFAFVSPPFLLALWCAATTLWTRRREFLRPQRLETELRLAPAEAWWLKAGATVVFAFCLLVSLLLWGWWLALSLSGIPTVDLLAWLPYDADPLWGWDFSFPTEFVLAPLMFCLFVDAICFVIWFFKWRYTGSQSNRILTHGGLRWWKEALGSYLIVLSVLYLGAALCGWPARVAAHRELEIQMERGELPR